MTFASFTASLNTSTRRSASLLALGSLLACHSTPSATSASAGDTPAAAPSRQPSPPTEPAANAFALLIDGQSKPLESLALVKTGEQGFQLKMQAPELDFTVIFTGKAPLAVGSFALINTTDSPCKASGQLPPPFNKESAPGYEFFASYLGPKSKPEDKTVYDWGTGPQKLRGESVGQVQITRLAGGTADGSFKSAVYTRTDTKSIASKNGSQTLNLFKGHQVQCTFQALPYSDPQADLEKAKKAYK